MNRYDSSYPTYVISHKESSLPHGKAYSPVNSLWVKTAFAIAGSASITGVFLLLGSCFFPPCSSIQTSMLFTGSISCGISFIAFCTAIVMVFVHKSRIVLPQKQKENTKLASALPKIVSKAEMPSKNKEIISGLPEIEQKTADLSEDEEDDEESYLHLADEEETGREIVLFQPMYPSAVEMESAPGIGCAINYDVCYDKNNEGEDSRWKGGWRCIQTCASSLGLETDFDALFLAFKEPTNRDKEWPEPGHAKRYFDTKGISNTLALYNTEEGLARTPAEVAEKFGSDFKQLREKILSHFLEYQTPIMIADIGHCFTIHGIKIHESRTILTLGDPYKTQKATCQYNVILDEEGKQLATTAIERGEPLKTAKFIDFHNKGWMLLFPQSRALAIESA
jgi:hypothetical protein